MVAPPAAPMLAPAAPAAPALPPLPVLPPAGGGAHIVANVPGAGAGGPAGGLPPEAGPECLVLPVLVRLLAWVVVQGQDRGPGQVLTAFKCITIL